MVYYYSFPQNAMKIHDSTVVQNIADGPDRVVTNRDNLEKAIAIERLPSRYWPSVFDRGPYLRDETWMQFVEWRMTTEENNAIEYIETLPTKIYVIPTKGRDVFYNKGGLRMADAFGLYNFRDTGILAYKAYLLEEHARDFMRSAEGEEFAIKHSELLSKAPDIDYIIIGKGTDSGIYAVAQICEHSAILFGNFDSYKMIDEWARREGIETDAFIRRAMGEEFAHLVRRGEATVQEEIDVRLWLIDMYNSLAEKTLDARAKARYQSMISALERDLSTVRQRYSKIYSGNMQKDLVGMYKSDPGKLELILEAEAILEEGLDGEDVKAYVASKLEKIAEAADDYEGEVGGGLGEYAGEADVFDGECVEVEVCAAAEGDGAEASDGGESSGE